MYISTEDARSDFILAAAAPVFGTMVARFVASIPFYPSGILFDLLLLAWVAALMLVPARYLARNREQGLEAYGLLPSRAGLGDGLLLAVPVLVVGYVRSFSSGSILGGLLGRLPGPLSGNPLVESLDPVAAAYNLALLVLAAVGTVWTYGFLVVRARDAFRQVDIPLLMGLRTFGLGAVGVGTLMGLLLAVARRDVPVWTVLVDAGALVVVVLITDRLVASNDRTTRATILAPMIVTVLTFVFGSGGGLFRGNLAWALHRGALAAALVAVVAVLLETRRSAWAAVPLIVATTWAPTCATVPIAPVIHLSC